MISAEPQKPAVLQISHARDVLRFPRSKRGPPAPVVHPSRPKGTPFAPLAAPGPPRPSNPSTPCPPRSSPLPAACVSTSAQSLTARSRSRSRQPTALLPSMVARSRVIFRGIVASGRRPAALLLTSPAAEAFPLPPKEGILANQPSAPGSSASAGRARGTRHRGPSSLPRPWTSPRRNPRPAGSLLHRQHGRRPDPPSGRPGAQPSIRPTPLPAGNGLTRTAPSSAELETLPSEQTTRRLRFDPPRAEQPSATRSLRESSIANGDRSRAAYPAGEKRDLSESTQPAPAPARPGLPQPRVDLRAIHRRHEDSTAAASNAPQTPASRVAVRTASPKVAQTRERPSAAKLHALPSRF